MLLQETNQHQAGEMQLKVKQIYFSQCEVDSCQITEFYSSFIPGQVI